jgi:hypothetical protein
MKHTLFAATATLAVVMTGAASAQLRRTVPDTSMPGTSAAALHVLLQDWDRAGFLPPSKPAQYRVYGRNGYVTSGPGYNFMAAEIRAAVADSQAGRDRAALAEIATVRSLLAPQPGDPLPETTALTPQ